MIYVWSTARKKTVDDIIGRTLRKRGAAYRIVEDLADLAGLTSDDVVLAMGAQALAALQKWGVCPKNQGLGACRERRWVKPDGSGPSILVTWAPTIVSREEKRRPELHWDAVLAARLHDTGSLRPPALASATYGWRDDLEELVLYVHELYDSTQKPVVVALDLETMGFFPYYPERHILTSQWSVESGRSFLVDHRHDDGTPCGQPTSDLPDGVRKQIEWLLNTEKVRIRGTNLKGDLQWIMIKWGVTSENFTFDTVLAGSLLNENIHNSLNAQCKMYAPELGGYDDEFSRKYDKGRLHEIPRHDPEFTQYAGGDSDATLRVSSELIPQLVTDPQLATFYHQLLHPAARCFEKIETRGILVDIPKAKALREEVKGYIRERTTEALKLVPLAVKARHAHNLKPTLPRLIVDHMFTSAGLNLKPEEWAAKQKWHVKGVFPKDKQPSTSVKEHLARFRAHPQAGPFIQCLEDLSRANKTLSTYLINDKGDKGFLTHLRPDGRLHPAYALAHGALWDNEDEGGAVSGRLSAKAPAWQTLPKHTVWAKKLRRLYPAPPGYLCWQLDFSQGELRVFACIANETRMIAAYQKGMDLHGITAAQANGIDVQEFLSWKALPKEHPNHVRWVELRQGGKAGNFGLLYRMSAQGFMEYAWKEYEVVMTLAQAKAFRKLWFETWPRVGPWHDEIVEDAYEQLYVRTPLGRIRHLPMLESPDSEIKNKAERQAINSPVQGTLSDLNLWATIGLEEHFAAHEDEFCVLGLIHDSMHGYVRDDAHTMQRMADAAGAVAARMGLITEVFGWEHQLPFPVDAELGANLADLEEIALAA